MRRDAVKALKAEIKKGNLTPKDARDTRNSYRRGIRRHTKASAAERQMLIKERRGLPIADRQMALRGQQQTRLQLRDAKRQARKLGNYTTRRGGSGR
jgi:hypothetical protein